MQLSAGTVIFSVLLLCACGPTGADGSGGTTAGFRARYESAYTADLEPGGLRIHVVNKLPKVEVAAEQIPTVAHLNGKICSTLSLESKEPIFNEDGNRVYPETKGVRRCFELSPTIYADASQDFTLTPSQVSLMINEDYTELELSFKTSTQWSSLFYSCSPLSLTRVVPATDAPNALEVKVFGQHSLSFACTRP